MDSINTAFPPAAGTAGQLPAGNQSGIGKIPSSTSSGSATPSDLSTLFSPKGVMPMGKKGEQTASQPLDTGSGTADNNAISSQGESVASSASS